MKAVFSPEFTAFTIHKVILPFIIISNIILYLVRIFVVYKN